MEVLYKPEKHLTNAWRSDFVSRAELGLRSASCVSLSSTNKKSMWHSENQRLGMKECSNKAYLLESWGDSLNVLSMPLFLLCVIGSPIISYFYGWSFMLLILVPLFMFIIAAIMRGSSESILKEKGFKYDYESDTVWIKDKIFKKK